MSIIKSFSVGLGDMFYLKHNSDNFTIIDCYLPETLDNRKEILNEIKKESSEKGIVRFISTHPDDDHIGGLDYLDDSLGIINFYCVENKATKTDQTDCFKRYCDLRDSKKSYYIEKYCRRKWMNETDETRGSSGISILWPNIQNEDYKNELEEAKNGNSPNNISPIIKYSLEKGVTALWMGDLETDFMEKIKDEVDFSKADILFAPHHGRESGKIPSDVLEKINPKIIIIGEAPSKNLNYYSGYNAITQNSAGDIIFYCREKEVDICVSNESYSVDYLENKNLNLNLNYIGTLNLD